jgi:trans-aconitate methyltransferase
MEQPPQSWDPDEYDEKAGYVAELGAPVVALLEARAGERILDLGCGDGTLTETLVARGCRVVGVDGSEAQVEAAQARGLDARVMDAQALPFHGEFDAVFSNAALHWMRDPDAVIDGVWRSLVPGGRFVGEMGGRGNVAGFVEALEAALDRRGHTGAAHNPWYFPDSEEYGQRLEARGFRVRTIRLIPRPTPLPHGVRGWIDVFGRAFVAPIPEPERAAFLDEVCEALRPRLFENGTWVADYVRLRFAADRPLDQADVTPGAESHPGPGAPPAPRMAAPSRRLHRRGGDVLGGAEVRQG